MRRSPTDPVVAAFTRPAFRCFRCSVCCFEQNQTAERFSKRKWAFSSNRKGKERTTAAWPVFGLCLPVMRLQWVSGRGSGEVLKHSQLHNWTSRFILSLSTFYLKLWDTEGIQQLWHLVTATIVSTTALQSPSQSRTHYSLSTRPPISSIYI